MRRVAYFCIASVLLFTTQAGRATAEEGNGDEAPGKPNILVIWGDDIGLWNVSAYNLGPMGYKAPNLDRIAREGALFTDLYGQQKAGSFSLDNALEVQQQSSGK